jgi:hypothetical protein
MSTRTVQRSLGDLEEVGLVRKESRFHDQGGQRSNLYYLQMPETEIDAKIDEVSFESYQEDEIAKDADKDILDVDIQVLDRVSEDNLKVVQVYSNIFLNQSVEQSVSWGDSHYDGP